MLPAVRIFIVILLMVSLQSFPARANDRTTEAERMVSTLIKTATKILNDPNGTLTEREKAFHAVLRDNIDFPFISVLVAGKFWKKMAREQQLEFQELLTSFYLWSYAPLLGGYPGDNTDLVAAKQIGSSDVIVTTRLKRKQRKDANAKWRLREIAGDLKIIDVVISGSSVGFSHRFGFTQRMEKKGIEGLLTLLRVKAEQVRTTP
ncbi:MlaC/ttg2D family ABC transporter substrate-binding protein [Sneathiella sp.]|uniref:MlaC/ttg2D family ABC transporter substrate-binding protein n=1 Tax=Sneathiella sp. TaxID=1964365 RepID=UPI0039E39707